MAAEGKAFEGWAILELMGHRRLAGYVMEVELAGAGFLRLDIPDGPCGVCGHPVERHTSQGMCAGEVDGDDCQCILSPESPDCNTRPGATQFYSPASVYALTPATEETCRLVRARPMPVQSFEVPRLPAITSGSLADVSEERDLGEFDEGDGF